VKVIADMSSSIKLVEVSDYEFAQLLGYDSIYSKGFDKDKIKVGFIIDICAFSKISEYVRNLNTKQLDDINGRLIDAQIQIKKAITFAEELKVFDILKDA